MECKLKGYDFKILEIILDPGETFYAERGALIYLESGVDKSVEFGKTAGSIIQSKLSGEAFFLVKFNNVSNVRKKMVVAGKVGVLPIKIDNTRVMCRRGAYIASTTKMNLGLKISVSSILGGAGLLQRIDGNGTVFLDSYGMPIEVDLGYNETIEVDENNLIALVGIEEHQLDASWSVGNMLHGEGLSLLRITGPGKVFINPTNIFTTRV